MYNSEGVAVAIVRRERVGRFCATAKRQLFGARAVGQAARARQ